MVHYSVSKLKGGRSAEVEKHVRRRIWSCGKGFRSEGWTCKSAAENRIKLFHLIKPKCLRYLCFTCDSFSWTLALPLLGLQARTISRILALVFWIDVQVKPCNTDGESLRRIMKTPKNELLLKGITGVDLLLGLEEPSCHLTLSRRL